MLAYLTLHPRQKNAPRAYTQALGNLHCLLKKAGRATQMSENTGTDTKCICIHCPRTLGILSYSILDVWSLKSSCWQGCIPLETHHINGWFLCLFRLLQSQMFLVYGIIIHMLLFMSLNIPYYMPSSVSKFPCFYWHWPYWIRRAPYSIKTSSGLATSVIILFPNKTTLQVLTIKSQTSKL